MRREITNGLAALMLSLATGASAQAQETTIADPVKVMRIFAPAEGWLRCDHWLTARSQDAEEARRLEAWALGYASAYTSHLENSQALSLKLSNKDLFSRIDVKCRALPLGVGAAVSDIIEDQAAH